MYLTVIRTPWNPEDEDNGYMRLSHVQVPRPKLVKGGAKRNESIKRQTFERFVADALIDEKHMALEYQEAIVDWLMVAGPASNLVLPSVGGRDAAVLILSDDGEPQNFGVREKPAYKLVNEDDEAADEMEDDEDDEEEADDEEDEGENRTYLDDDEDDEEPFVKPPRKKLKPKKKPR